MITGEDVSHITGHTGRIASGCTPFARKRVGICESGLRYSSATECDSNAIIIAVRLSILFGESYPHPGVISSQDLRCACSPPRSVSQGQGRGQRDAETLCTSEDCPRVPAPKCTSRPHAARFDWRSHRPTRSEPATYRNGFPCPNKICDGGLGRSACGSGLYQKLRMITILVYSVHRLSSCKFVISSISKV